MTIGLCSIGAGRAARPEVLVRIARKAEEVGFASLFAPEHTVVFPPEQYTSVYPYAADGKIAGLRGDTDLLDPFLALSWAAAHTTTLRHGHLPRAAAQPADDRQRGRYPGCAVGRAVSFRSGDRLAQGGIPGPRSAAGTSGGAYARVCGSNESALDRHPQQPVCYASCMIRPAQSRVFETGVRCVVACMPSSSPCRALTWYPQAPIAVQSSTKVPSGQRT